MGMQASSNYNTTSFGLATELRGTSRQHSCQKETPPSKVGHMQSMRGGFGSQRSLNGSTVKRVESEVKMAL